MGGPDPIDVLLKSRPALGLAPAAAPALLFVPLGFVLGPGVLGVLSGEVLGHLDVVVSLALGTLGVFVGLGLDLGPGERRLLAAASVESLVTILVVMATSAHLMSSWGLALDGPPAVALGLALGVAASASAAGPGGPHDAPHRAATRIADLDDVLPIVLGGFVIAAAPVASWPSAGGLTLATIALGVAGAVAGWLLFESALGSAERGVFVAGAVLLLAGGAAYLGVSPLLSGLVAGACWRALPGGADRVARDDLRKFQHPLVVMLLVVAGATLTSTRAGIWLLAPFLAFRLAGKLVGGWLASRLAPGVAPSHLGAHLVAPGVLGIAFALNFRQVSPSAAGDALLFAATVGSLMSEVLALAAHPPAGRAR
jgi:hypothetical protein